MQRRVPFKIIASERHIHPLRREINRATRRVKMHLHARMGALKIGQAGNQPHHGDRGFTGHNERRGHVRLLQLRQPRPQLLEQTLRHGKQLAPCIG
jgi:4-hydroxy-L-threonine phosphate dehydrogenase PdxA